jgi:outer membrane protein assembly factor BamB
MTRSRISDVVYIGIGSHVVAIQATSGEELWRTKLTHSTFVTISLEGDKLYAGANGELFCLEPSSGTILWHNQLKGLGLGIIAFTGAAQTSMSASVVSAQAATTAATM